MDKRTLELMQRAFAKWKAEAEFFERADEKEIDQFFKDSVEKKDAQDESRRQG